MASDYEKISGRDRGRSSWRKTGLLLFVAFLIGAVAAGWLLSRFEVFSADQKAEAVAEQVESTSPLAGRIDENGRVVAVSDELAVAEDVAPLTPERQRALAARVADLEDRLSRINVQARAASGNAGRAEGLLIAFAARRALDKGSSLGYIEDQLRLRFGEAQPRAVRTVINAANAPVTLEELVTKLDDTGPTLAAGGQDAGLWANIQNELSGLFVLRKEGTPSPAPQQRLQRAQRYLEAGNVEAAITEVQRMKNSDVRDEWLELARRYNEARRALDVIETAAILEPRELRDARGTAIRQPSPLAPDDIAPIPQN